MANITETKSKKGIVYKVQIRHKGYKPIYKRFYNINPKEALKAAKLWADDIELQIRKGTYKENIPALNGAVFKIDTVSELIEYFQKNIAPKRYSYHDKYDVIYDWWKNQIGNIKVKDLSASILSSCKQILSTEKVKKGKETIIRGNSTINKYLMGLSAILSYAVKELELIENNPMSRVKLMEKPLGRTRFLTDDEIPILTQACKNHSDTALLFFLLLLFTGGRYNEALTLQVENIDFKNSRILYLNTKNKTHRGVGIDKKFLKFIKKYLDKNNIKEGYIFLNKDKNCFIYMKGVLEKIIKESGIKDFHIHDLRHTFASTAAKNGASLLDIAILLGHKSLVMARRYSHLTLQHTDKVAIKAASTMNIGKDIF